MARLNKADKADKLAKVHDGAIREFNSIWTQQYDERKQCREDRRFVSIAGAQWEGDLSRQFENRPKLEVNKIQLALIRIYNQYRNNRITVDFEPIDGTENDPMADTCDDLYRGTERASGANEAYDNAFDEGTSGGIGAWRYTTAYVDEYEEDEDKQHQKILIEPIYDADYSVFFSLDAKKQDKSDAKRGYVIHSYTKETFEEKWPDEDLSSWPAYKEHDFDWHSGTDVKVAEYYEVEDINDTEYTYKKITGEEIVFLKSELNEVEEGELTEIETIEAQGGTLEDTRKIRRRAVHKYFMSARGILEDCGVIAGPNIPITPYFGKRFYIDGIERAMGHVRLPKDMQRLENMQISGLAEAAASPGIETPIVTPGQIANHATQWEAHNIENYAYLLLNPMLDKDGNELPAGPLGYTKAATLAPAQAALLQYTDQNIKGLLGNPEAGEKIVSNISNEAVESVQDALDMHAYIYMENFSKAMKRGGEIWKGMAKEIFTESISKGRKLKGITKQGKVRQIELMRPVKDKDTGETVLENDFNKLDMEVIANVGPSNSTKRKATVRALTNMMPLINDPATTKVLTSMAMMNMEGEGIEDAREYFRKELVGMGVIKPTEQEAKDMAQAAQNQPQSAQDNLANALAEESAAKVGKLQADTVQSGAKTENLNADTAEKLSGIERDDRTQLLDTVDRATQP